MNPYVIAICHQKGGVAKTTTTLSLGASLVERGTETLVIDLDPQANLTTSIGLNLAEMRYSIAEAVLDGIDLKSILLETSLPGLDIVPASAGMLSFTRRLFELPNYEYCLRQTLAGPAASEYGFVFLDCPPTLGPITFSALTAADMLIIPTQCEYFSIQALGEMFKAVNVLRETTNPELVYRLLVTMFDGRGTFHKRMFEQMQEHFNEGLFQTAIGFDTKLRESQLAGMPITVYAPQTRSAQQYRQLAQEVLIHIADRQLTQTM